MWGNVPEIERHMTISTVCDCYFVYRILPHTLVMCCKIFAEALHFLAGGKASSLIGSGSTLSVPRAVVIESENALEKSSR